jgi:hypothetical protein
MMLNMMGGAPEPDGTARRHESHRIHGTGPGLGGSGEDAAR